MGVPEGEKIHNGEEIAFGEILAENYKIMMKDIYPCTQETQSGIKKTTPRGIIADFAKTKTSEEMSKTCKEKR